MADLDSTLLDLSATNFKSSEPPTRDIYIPTPKLADTIVPLIN